MKKPGCGCALFGLAILLTALGAGVIIASLCTLSITTSFLKVFPFGSPVWCGTMLLLFGIFSLLTQPLTKVHLMSTSNKPQVCFILFLSSLTALECLLSIILTSWYQASVAPSLSNCAPTLVDTLSTPTSSALSVAASTLCECAAGFTNPPSLQFTVRYFSGVSDCSSLRGRLKDWHGILIALYIAGSAVSIAIAALAMRRLHVLGICGNSGVYSVTPEPTTPIDPAPIGHSYIPNGSVMFTRQSSGMSMSSRLPARQSTVNSITGSSPVRSILRLASTPSNSSRSYERSS